MPHLCATSLRFGYGKEPLIEDLSLQVEDGEFLALIGPNGCGKTTLLKLLSGVLRPQAGAVTLGGRPLHRLRPAAVAKEIAALEQHIHTEFGFRVHELVAMGRLPHLSRLQGLGESDRQIVEEAMGLTGIQHLAQRSLHQISSGERQRVWLAMALAQQPKILLLDEPTTHLDLNYQIEMLDLLRSLSLQRKLTIVMSIHELHLIGPFAHRIALMQHGELLQIGSPEEILTEALIQRVFQIQIRSLYDPKTQRFLGIVPVPPDPPQTP